MGNGDAPNRIEKFNQLVRSLVTLALVAGFLYSALIVQKVSQETFNNLVLLVVTWWFARDAAHAAVKESVSLLKEPPPSATAASLTAPPGTSATVEVKP